MRHGLVAAHNKTPTSSAVRSITAIIPDAADGPAQEDVSVETGTIKLNAIGNKQSPFIFRGKINRCHARILIDSGATGCFVSDSFVVKHRMKTIMSADPRVVVLADGRDHGCGRELDPKYNLKIGPTTVPIDESLYVLPLHEQFDVILGMPWLRKWSAKLDLGDEESLTLLVQGHEVVLKPNDQRSEDSSTKASFLMSIDDLEEAYYKSEDIYVLWLSQISGKEDDSAEDAPDAADKPADLQALLNEFSDVFPPELPKQLPPNRGVHHEIRLVEGASPPAKRMYRFTYAEKQEMQAQVTELLEKGLIKYSKSPFGASPIFVTKKDGAMRMCIDFRALNELTVKNKSPLPNIEDLFDSLRGAKFFTSLDLKSGFWQIPVKPEDREKTAFMTPFGLFEWTVMPFGLCNAPGTFQTLMNRVLSDMINIYVLVYVDDILIFSKTWEEHLRHLRLVFERLRQQKLYCAVKKCMFGRTELPWLGHVISADGIAVDAKKTAVVRDWPQPKNVNDVLSFLGLCGYFRKYIESYSRIALPLTDLTKKDQPWIWGPAQQEAFDTLKAALVSPPVLIIPSPEHPFVLHTDASKHAIGAVLLQDQGQGLRVVGYFSRKLRGAEVRYSTYEQEVLGLIEAVQEYRHYLMGSPKSTVFVDQQAITSLLKQTTLNGRQARWIVVLQMYNLHVKYVPGKLNTVADALSRRVDGSEEELTIASIIHQEKLSLSSIATTLHSSPEWLAELSTSYGGDDESAAIVNGIHAKTLPKYSLDNGIIVYTHSATHKSVYVPKNGDFRRYLLSAHHDSYLAGHLGIDKTYELLARHWYWPRMKADVTDYVKSCPVCAVTKSSNQKPGGFMVPLEIPSKKFETIHIDLVTHLGETASGNDSVLTVTDKLTKHVTIFPTTIKSDGSIIADLLYNKYFCRFGIPNHIISDNDPRWTSQYFKILCEKLGVKMHTGTAYHPQSNGQAERTNRTVEDMLRCYTRSFGGEWDEHLNAIEFSYNNSLNASTGFTPFFLVYGQHPTLPSDVDIDSLLEVRHQSAVDFLRVHSSSLELAKQHLQAAQARQQRYVNRRRRDVEFKVGDLVLLSTENLRPSTTARKLSPKKCGPFKILERIGKAAYKLDLPDVMKTIHPVFHVSLLQPYYKSSVYSSHDRTLRPDSLDYLDLGPDVFLVDRILDKRLVVDSVGKKYPEVLVLWKNYPETEATWEPVSNLVSGFNVARLRADICANAPVHKLKTRYSK